MYHIIVNPKSCPDRVRQSGCGSESGCWKKRVNIGFILPDIMDMPEKSPGN